MRISILPKTTLGKWSTGLITAFIVFLAAFQLLVASLQRGDETFFSNLVLTSHNIARQNSGDILLLSDF